ncbi:uncharacterized exonuclease domain-containing protein At3g15140 isoform X1 [Selaginella moellendorffii]|uniref:uncharacterized exonuclease domain-containing protein At3g15140 isoform X1 n=2 Tax=Selaginella moellendorffii TaxID=88036 RepID=UPI000D1C7517|nr:uncharacterized exonuclease domain-containing protein At3g15140 isoform X1 [Selaginella moellendorffii]|eukprot:XP_024527693.1 uncharacterized exonuclease domain-containing protein At3g15140 isoform X1 [Selaginella moellendorffii]
MALGSRVLGSGRGFLSTFSLKRQSYCQASRSDEATPSISPCGAPNHGRFEDLSRRRKPMCLYFTQNRCQYMDSPEHLEKFSHTFPELDPVVLDAARPLPRQPFDKFLVLDLEGKVEILEFPVVLLDAKTLTVVDRFHRFVRPCELKGSRLQAYIAGKYGRWKLERLWEDTAIPFQETLLAFEDWLEQHSLRDPESHLLKNSAFVTCGNWDIKTKIPEQCITSGIPLPSYFCEWINLKDIFLNFYNKRAPGMLSMMRSLDMRVQGSHHLGLDDAHNIARIVQKMESDGAVLSITAKRRGNRVEFLFQNRV